MVFDLLPSLRPRAKHATVCVRVSRRWEYRGGTDDGPIGHVDLVLIDEKGNAMYAEIPGTEVETKAPLILEGGVYMISRFRVSSAKSGYRPVPGQFMIEFTCYTRIEPMRGNHPDIPEYTYHLTSFEDLPARVGDTRNFIDVIGTLVEVSEVRMVRLPNKPAATLTRDIVLMGLSNTDMKVTLWGHRASDFTTHDVYDAKDPKPVVVLLVGCLMKSFQGQDYLSANTACHWYFNPNIPEAEPFYNRLQNQRIEIKHTDAPAAAQTQPRPVATPETMLLSDLEYIDPYDFPDEGYRVTVTIARLVPDTTWWFPCCNRCSRSCVEDGCGGYRCNSCSCTTFKYRYKLCFIATDGTAEAQMICFGDAGRRVVGKPVQQILRTAKSTNGLPPDIAGVVSLKFTFDIALTQQSYYRSEKQYQVNSVVISHGRERTTPVTTTRNSSAPPVASQVAAINVRDSSVAPVVQDGSQLAPASPVIVSNNVSSKDMETPPPPSEAIDTPVQKAETRVTPAASKRTSARKRLCLAEESEDEPANDSSAPAGSG